MTRATDDIKLWVQEGHTHALYERRVLEGLLRHLGFSEAQIAARSRMYINSGREAYERANARTIGVPELPQYPGDSQTVCLTNCKCHWDIQEVTDDEDQLVGWDCTWVINPAAENCPDCQDNSQAWAPLHVPVP